MFFYIKQKHQKTQLAMPVFKKSAVKGVVYGLPPFSNKAPALLRQLLVGPQPTSSLPPPSTSQHRLQIECAGSGKILKVLYIPKDCLQTLRSLLGAALEPFGLATSRWNSRLRHWFLSCTVRQNVQAPPFNLGQLSCDVKVDRLVVCKDIPSNEIKYWNDMVHEWVFIAHPFTWFSKYSQTIFGSHYEFGVATIFLYAQRYNMHLNQNEFLRHLCRFPEPALKAIVSDWTNFYSLSYNMRRNFWLALRAFYQCMKSTFAIGPSRYDKTLKFRKHLAWELRCNHKFILAAMDIWDGAINLASRLSYENRDLIYTSLSKYKTAFEEGIVGNDDARWIFDDEELMMVAVQMRGDRLQYASKQLRRHNKSLVLAAVTQDARVFEAPYVFPWIYRNRDIVFVAVRQRGKYIEHADSSLRDDKELAMAAVQNDGCAIRFLSARLRHFRSVAVAALLQNVDAFEHTRHFNGDKEIMLHVVSKCGWYFQFATDQLRDDRVVAAAAVGSNGYMLQYVSRRLRDDLEIVKIAIARNSSVFKFASVRLRHHPEIIETFLLEPETKKLRKFLYPKYTWGNTDVNNMKPIVRLNGLALKATPAALCDDRELVTIAVQNNGLALRFASERLKGDREIAMLAVQQNPDAFSMLSFKLRQDLQLAIIAVRHRGLSLQSVHPKLKQNFHIVLAAVQQNGNALKYAHWTLRANYKIVLAAVQQSGFALEYASIILRDTFNIVRAAVQQTPRAIEHAGWFCRHNHKIILAHERAVWRHASLK